MSFKARWILTGIGCAVLGGLSSGMAGCAGSESGADEDDFADVFTSNDDDDDYTYADDDDDDSAADWQPPFQYYPGVEGYDDVVENPFLDTESDPTSTFSIDVDTGSYSNVRRILMQGQMPPVAAIRIEEFINYFDFDYPQPTDGNPFSVNVTIADAPWNDGHRLARIGLKGLEIEAEERPDSNLVFLIDVSGSMSGRLWLVKYALNLLVESLREEDRVAIVVYAGNSGLVLDSTPGSDRNRIKNAINALEGGGSTNGGAGIQLAYQVAAENYITGGVNRVILATDGDFNVGVTSHSALLELIKEKAETGVFLTALGFGYGNIQDNTLEMLADNGNGFYAYVDTEDEAKKVFVDQLTGSLVTIAKDVKVQVHFNPAVVAAYRLIGYENRILNDEDFDDDTKDAGEIGAGHRVTALYELVPAETPDPEAASFDLALRYKEPEAGSSVLLEYSIMDEGKSLDQADGDFHFAAAVAGFGMILRGSPHAGTCDYEMVNQLAETGLVPDPNGYRQEFVELVGLAAQHPVPEPQE